MTKTVVRRATVDDAVGIATVHIASWRETYRGIVPDPFLKDLSIERRTANWIMSLSDPNHEYHRAFVAEVEGQLVGFSNYGFNREKDLGIEGELFAVYLLRSSQKKGIGRQLVEAAAGGLLSMAAQSMLVWVLAENPARGFYERLGGEYLRQKKIEIGGKALVEIAYGWKALSRFQR